MYESLSLDAFNPGADISELLRNRQFHSENVAYSCIPFCKGIAKALDCRDIWLKDGKFDWKTRNRESRTISFKFVYILRKETFN